MLPALTSAALEHDWLVVAAACVAAVLVTLAAVYLIARLRGARFGDKGHLVEIGASTI